MADEAGPADYEPVALDKFGFFLHSNDINVTKDSDMTPKELAILRRRERGQQHEQERGDYSHLPAPSNRSPPVQVAPPDGVRNASTTK